MQIEESEKHFKELYNRLKAVLLVFLIFSALGFVLSGDIIHLVQSDLGVALHSITPYEIIYAQLMISGLLGIIFSFPVIFYHIVKFVKPGLTKKEYKVFRNLIPFSFLLFVFGGVFSYQVILKTVLGFFESYTFGADVEPVWSLMYTVVFGFQLSVLIGLMFQIPIISVLLAKLDLITASKMIEYRNHFLIAVLAVSALLTPPDLITQLLVTLPVILLYQLSIHTVKIID